MTDDLPSDDGEVSSDVGEVPFAIKEAKKGES
jgi:hypothetical protein